MKSETLNDRRSSSAVVYPTGCCAPLLRAQLSAAVHAPWFQVPRAAAGRRAGVSLRHDAERVSYVSTRQG
eukprot:365401-Chlamydomonas_euryale.AAC.10